METKANLRDTAALAKLKKSLLIYKSSAHDAVNTVKKYLQERLTWLKDQENQLRDAQRAAYEEYKAAESAYNACVSQTCTDDEGNPVPCPCGAERRAKNNAYKEWKKIESKYNRCKNIVGKALRQEKSFNATRRQFEHLSGRQTELAVQYLDQIIAGVLDYNATVLPNQKESKVLTNSDFNELKKQGLEIDMKKEFKINDFIGIGGIKFEIKNRIIRDSAGDIKQIMYNVYKDDNPDNPWGSFTKKNKNDEIGILGDFQVPAEHKRSTVFGNDENSVLYNVEKTAKDSGCKQMKAWVDKKDLSFYENCGYKVLGDKNDERGGGFEVYKNL